VLTKGPHGSNLLLNLILRLLYRPHFGMFGRYSSKTLMMRPCSGRWGLSRSAANMLDRWIGC